MTTKKPYEKPAMQVFELKQQPSLLAGSGEGLDPLSPFSPGVDPLAGSGGGLDPLSPFNPGVDPLNP